MDEPERARSWHGDSHHHHGGCIIRGKLFNDITSAYRRSPNLPNLLIDNEFQKVVNARQDA